MSQTSDRIPCPRCQANNFPSSDVCWQCGQPLQRAQFQSQPGSPSAVHTGPRKQQPPKGPDEIYCPACGEVVKKDAVICLHCGVAVASAGYAFPKDKAVAVILAIFLAFWTWVYTYQRDAWKFWLNLALTIVSCGWWAFVAWVWAIIDVAVKPKEYYSNYPRC